MPPPDLPCSDHLITLEKSLLTERAPLVNKHTSYRFTFATVAAYSLTFIGACSDALQKLFGSGQALGVSDLTVASFEATRFLPIVRVVYLILGSIAAFIQSIGLEKTFTFDFVKQLCGLTTPETDSDVANPLATQPLFIASLTLNRLETLSLALLRVSGALVRGVSSLLGFYTVSNSAKLEIRIPSIGAASVDTLQTIATEGVYLKNLYLLMRLKLKSKWNPQAYSDAELVTFIKRQLDETHHACRSLKGYLTYLAAMSLGSLAVLSDVGLAKCALDDFIELYGLDNDALYIAIPKLLGLSSLFLLITAIDSQSLANQLSAYVENPVTPILEQAPSRPLRLGLAGTVSILGASMTAMGAYAGNQELLTQFTTDNSALIPAASILIASVKFIQSLAVEGRFTLKMAA